MVPTHRLKTRKQGGSSPRDFLTNLVEKYLLQTQRVRTRQYLCSRSEAGAGVIPLSPFLFSSATFLPSIAKGSIRLGNTRPTLLLEAQPLDPTRRVQYRDMCTPNPVSTVQLPDRCYTLDFSYPLMVASHPKRSLCSLTPRHGFQP